MSATSTDYAFPSAGNRSARLPGPVIDKTHWGYAIRDGDTQVGLRAVAAALGRFVGTILLLAAAGLMVMPDSAHGAGILSMKVAALVMFVVFGAALVLAGRPVQHPEIHVDTTRAEVRVGRRGVRGAFRLVATLAFGDVASVYLLRSKDHSQPTRLFLRITGSDQAIEVARGTEASLEELRGTLTRDLARHPCQPVELQLGRHACLTA